LMWEGCIEGPTLLFAFRGQDGIVDRVVALFTD
jgi:hypothetical protein